MSQNSELRTAAREREREKRERAWIIHALDSFDIDPIVSLLGWCDVVLLGDSALIALTLSVVVDVVVESDNAFRPLAVASSYLNSISIDNLES